MENLCDLLLLAEEEQDLRFAIELSMQDTAALDMSDNRPPVVGCATNSDTWAAAAADHSVCNANTESNVFGVIKDVKISNIVASDDDKTVQFETKNFKHMIGQSLVSTPLVESSVAAVSFSQDEQYNPSSMAGCSSGC